ncbi:Predicted enzyme of the cupin superfamily [Pseudomonas flavescens]|uniref:Predicted enzyme of the cupin superfamily n=1 Tax=Phytopseudomonas flavescens TaxID=29435 RepID=A0A1G8H5N6_9GAMM|nr:cupin domain-containing protein [Pseudomonas flavescens]SDI01820.1 Predicted enzyme of the cupin superfamily [Pseudomonas flavescens]
MIPIVHFAQPAAARRLPDETASRLIDDPLAEGRHVHFQEPRQGYVTGVARAMDSDRSFSDYPWVELSIIEAGTLHIEGDGYALTVSAGETLVVPRGANLRWWHHGELRRIFVAFNGPASLGDMPARALKIDAHAGLQPCRPPSAEVLLTPEPVARSHTQFASGGCLRIGIWSCTAYARRQVEPGYSELMYFYEGSVAFATPGGKRYEVKAGEAILIPAGASNAWRNDVAVKKLFCILA